MSFAQRRKGAEIQHKPRLRILFGLCGSAARREIAFPPCLLDREVIELRGVPRRADSRHSLCVARVRNICDSRAVDAHLNGRALESQSEVVPRLRRGCHLPRCQLVQGRIKLRTVQFPRSIVLEREDVGARPTRLVILEHVGGIDAPDQGYASRLLDHRVRADLVVRPIGIAEESKRVGADASPRQSPAYQ